MANDSFNKLIRSTESSINRPSNRGGMCAKWYALYPEHIRSNIEYLENRGISLYNKLNNPNLKIDKYIEIYKTPKKARKILGLKYEVPENLMKVCYPYNYATDRTLNISRLIDEMGIIEYFKYIKKLIEKCIIPHPNIIYYFTNDIKLGEDIRQLSSDDITFKVYANVDEMSVESLSYILYREPSDEYGIYLYMDSHIKIYSNSFRSKQAREIDYTNNLNIPMYHPDYGYPEYDKIVEKELRDFLYSKPKFYIFRV